MNAYTYSCGPQIDFTFPNGYDSVAIMASWLIEEEDSSFGKAWSKHRKRDRGNGKHLRILLL